MFFGMFLRTELPRSDHLNKNVLPFVDVWCQQIYHSIAHPKRVLFFRRSTEGGRNSERRRNAIQWCNTMVQGNDARQWWKAMMQYNVIQQSTKLKNSIWLEGKHCRRKMVTTTEDTQFTTIGYLCYAVQCYDIGSGHFLQQYCAPFRIFWRVQCAKIENHFPFVLRRSIQSFVNSIGVLPSKKYSLPSLLHWNTARSAGG